MPKVLGVDAAGKVWLVLDWSDPSYMPALWNGIALTAQLLTDEQAAAFDALPPDRGGTTFIGGALAAIDRPAPALARAMTVDDKLAMLGLTVADLKAALAK